MNLCLLKMECIGHNNWLAKNGFLAMKLNQEVNAWTRSANTSYRHTHENSSVVLVGGGSGGGGGSCCGCCCSFSEDYFHSNILKYHALVVFRLSEVSLGMHIAEWDWYKDVLVNPVQSPRELYCWALLPSPSSETEENDCCYWYKSSLTFIYRVTFVMGELDRFSGAGGKTVLWKEFLP